MNMDEKNLTCKICFESFDSEARKPEVLVPCGHTFCRDCIDRLGRPKCPVCKTLCIKRLVVWDMIPTEASSSSRENTCPELLALKDELSVYKSELDYTAGLVNLSCQLSMRQLDNAEKMIGKEADRLINRIVGEKNTLIERVKRGKHSLKNLDSWTRIKMAGVEASYNVVSFRARHFRPSSNARQSKGELSELIKRDMGELRRLNEPLRDLSNNMDAYTPAGQEMEQRFLGQVNDQYLKHLDDRYRDLLSSNWRSDAQAQAAPTTLTSADSEALTARKILKAVRRVNPDADRHRMVEN